MQAMSILGTDGHLSPLRFRQPRMTLRFQQPFRTRTTQHCRIRSSFVGGQGYEANLSYRVECTHGLLINLFQRERGI